MNSKFTFFLLFVLSVSCSSDYSPKPKGYFHIDLPEPVYHDYAGSRYFKFSFSNQAFVEDVRNASVEMKEKNGTGLNIYYPSLHAQIYCSYFRLNKDYLPVFLEESQQMVYNREKKAKGVRKIEFSHPEQKVYGVVYEIQGEAISPIQFVISDSTNSFFRGALFFDTFYNRDSIAPVLVYINKDIQIMIESFRWKQ